MEDQNPTNGANEPTSNAVVILANTPEFDAFLVGRTELINAPLREYEARNRRLRMIGEIIEVVAAEGMPLTPSQILTIAEAALQDPKLTKISPWPSPSRRQQAEGKRPVTSPAQPCPAHSRTPTCPRPCSPPGACSPTCTS